MAKKKTINEKEVFDIFKNYDKTSILFNYKYTEQEKKSEDALSRSLRRKWIATLKKNGIKPNDMIEGGIATTLLVFFILELNGTQKEVLNAQKEVLNALGLGVNKPPDKLVKKSMALNKSIVSVQHSSEPQFSLFYGLSERKKEQVKESYVKYTGKQVEEAKKRYNKSSEKEKEALKVNQKEKIHQESKNLESIPFKNFETGHLELIDVFSELVQLHSSNTTDIDKKNYYTGEAKVFNQNGTAPEIITSYYQLAKHFRGIDRPSSSDVNKVKKLVKELENNPEYHLVTINKRTKRKGGKTETLTYVEANPIIKEIAGVIETKDNKTKESIKEGFRGIKLNPIFAKDLATRYILEPLGFRLQMKEAVKKLSINKTGQLTRVIIILAKYLSYQKTINRNKNNGCFHTERLSLLLPKLNIKLIEQRKTKRLIIQLEEAINVLKEVGLIASSEYTLSVEGEKMLKVELNKNWGSVTTTTNESKLI